MLPTILFFGCNKKNNGLSTHSRTHKQSSECILNDSVWVKNNEFVYGDIRRYGFLKKELSKAQLDSILNIGSKGIDLIFPKGVYPINFFIENKEDIRIHFDSAIIAGKLSLQKAKNIDISGRIEILDILFIKNSKDLRFENVRLRTDKTINIANRANRGVNIYSGSKDIFFKNLKIMDSGGEDVFFAYSHAALMIHGFFNVPERVLIENVLIKNSKRTGAYISGIDHSIQTLKVVDYGISKNTSGIKPVEMATLGKEKIFSGVWLNMTENNNIDTLIIKNGNNQGDYSIIFDESKGLTPNFVQAISISDSNTYMTNLNSNTIVLSEF